MNEKELAQLVAQMRQAQRNYFRTRTGGDLLTSKRLEKEVDTAVADILGNNQTLFNPQTSGNSEGI